VNKEFLPKAHIARVAERDDVPAPIIGIVFLDVGAVCGLVAAVHCGTDVGFLVGMVFPMLEPASAGTVVLTCTVEVSYFHGFYPPGV
jgi:hypothetical protein